MLLLAPGSWQTDAWESKLVRHRADGNSSHCSQQVLHPEPASPADGMGGEYFINSMGTSASLFGFVLPSAWGGGKGSCEGAVKRTKNNGAEKSTADRQLQRRGDNNGWTHPRWREMFFPE